MQVKDHVAGFVNRGKKWNPETQKYEDAMFLNIYTYQTDEHNEPKQLGTRKLSNGQEVPRYALEKVYRVPLSKLSGVVAGDKKRCQIFWSEIR